MKLFKLLIIAFCILVSSKVWAAHQLYADANGITIPYGTKLKLQMASDITTETISRGDSFQATLANDIYVNNKLILPTGSLFRGRVADIKYSRMLSRPAILNLTLDHLVTKTGEQIPINSGFATSFDYVLKPDGTLTTNGNYFNAVKRDAKNSTKLISKSINWGKSTGLGAIVLVPIGAIGGTLGCAGVSIYSVGADLFRRGDEIIIKKGSEFDIILLTRLDIPT